MILTPAQIAEATGGRLVRDAPAGPLHTDTRHLVEGAWFLALRGENFDGHNYLEAAASLGCAGVIAETAPDDFSKGLVLVDDTLAALQDCARAVRRGFVGDVVAVTGSAGKTTTRALVGSVLSQAHRVHETQGNFNNHIGLPLTLMALSPDADVLVLEMGMSAPGEIHLLQDIASPTIRIITNVSAAHTEGTGSIDGVALCKQELFDGARPGDLLVVNADDSRVEGMPRPEGTRVLRYGTSQDCDFQLLEASIDEQSLATHARIQTPDNILEVVLAAPGHHIAMNACAAVAVAWSLGLESLDIVQGLASWKVVGMRMRVENLEEGVVVLNDAYNANPASTTAALKTLACTAGDRKVALLGDMLELGAAEDAAHEAMVREAAAAGVGMLGLVGPRYGAFASLASELIDGELLLAEDSASLARKLEGKIRAGDVVLLKGSRGIRMERVLEGLVLGESSC